MRKLPRTMYGPSQYGVMVSSSSMGFRVGCTLGRPRHTKGTAKEVSMAEQKASVLVVANRTAESDELLEALRKRAQDSPASFHLVVPATARGVSRVADMQIGRAWRRE